ncbi:hypothetical protein Cgig2_032439 [Carnegiea gigantea]|uniref:ATPase AAA-type core domain-containing protein n=1 Tax=Carnegiea gigantea TaxID=171969 RepID=A0A9Q1KW66_9CARY|nr:hypothetical protein Cgig2_032439 [Carnegiea gigantea]
MLSDYGIDLTNLAEKGELDPLITSDGDIDHVVQSLCKRRKNSPCLLGRPGIGVALVIQLKKGNLLAHGGSTSTHKFGERLVALIDELEKADGTFILFVDDLDLLVRLVVRYEAYHNVRYMDEALTAAAQLSSLHTGLVSLSLPLQLFLLSKFSEVYYFLRCSNGFLIDKAIDMIDEAGARVSLEIIGSLVHLRAIACLDGGQLTNAVLQKPQTVLLLDEIEKAHQDVYDIFLQILENGRLTDGRGVTVDFTSTIIIFTSNIGYKLFNTTNSGGSCGLKRRVMEELKKVFRPELLNRLDDILVFRQLTQDDIGKIAEMMLNKVYQRADALKLTLKIRDSVKNKPDRGGIRSGLWGKATEKVHCKGGGGCLGSVGCRRRC